MVSDVVVPDGYCVINIASGRNTASLLTYDTPQEAAVGADVWDDAMPGNEFIPAAYWLLAEADRRPTPVGAPTPPRARVLAESFARHYHQVNALTKPPLIVLIETAERVIAELGLTVPEPQTT